MGRPNDPIDARSVGESLARSPIDAFVQTMADDLRLTGSPADRRTRRQLRRICEWATAEGLPLDRELVLDPDTVERFSEKGLADDRPRATYRAVLRRVGPLLTKKAPWEPRPPSIARRTVAVPYSPEEVDLLRADALLQPTESRRRAARALLALGLGAGLDGRWVSRVVAVDITKSPHGVLIKVGDPSFREVVCLREWESEVYELALTAGEERLIGGRSSSANRISNLVDSLLVPTGHPKLAPARLRSTWLVHHIAAGTRLPELCQAAGLKGVTVVSDLLEFIDMLQHTQATAMLRGPAS
jgi:hypothetical protein